MLTYIFVHVCLYSIFAILLLELGYCSNYYLYIKLHVKSKQFN